MALLEPRCRVPRASSGADGAKGSGGAGGGPGGPASPTGGEGSPGGGIAGATSTSFAVPGRGGSPDRDAAGAGGGSAMPSGAPEAGAPPGGGGVEGSRVDFGVPGEAPAGASGAPGHSQGGPFRLAGLEQRRGPDRDRRVMVRRLRGGDAKALHGVRRAAEETACARCGSASHRVAALVAVIVSTVAGRDDSSRRDSRPALRLAARAVAGWVPPPLTPVSVAGQPGRVQHFVARGADHVRRRRENCRRVRWCGGSSHRAIRPTLRRGSWETSSRKASSTPRRRAAGWLSGNPRGTARWSRTPRLSACHPRPIRVSSPISSTTCAPATAACCQGWTPLRTRAPPRRCSRPPTSSARVWWVTWT